MMFLLITLTPAAVFVIGWGFADRRRNDAFSYLRQRQEATRRRIEDAGL